jgi:hypothetical protein
VGELRGGLEGLGSREAAGADEVLLHGEARVWGNSWGCVTPHPLAAMIGDVRHTRNAR